MKVSTTQIGSILAIILGLCTVYFWFLFIDNYGFVIFLGILVLSWILNIAVGEVNTETDPERRAAYDKVVDAVKSVVGFFAYSTLATATIMVLYNVANVGVYLYGKLSDFVSGSVDAYRRF